MSPRTATYVYIYDVKSDVYIHVYIYLGTWAGQGSRINQKSKVATLGDTLLAASHYLKIFL